MQETSTDTTSYTVFAILAAHNRHSSSSARAKLTLVISLAISLQHTSTRFFAAPN